MPLYEYECDACGHLFELIQRFADPPIETCPQCGGGVHKRQSAPAFQFKGTGWYITDYAKKDKPADGTTGAADKAATGGDTAAKGEKGEKAGTTESGSKTDTGSKTESSPASPTPTPSTTSSTTKG